MKVLITGGAGYIGTNLCPKLIEMGYELVIVDDFVNAKKEYIESLQKQFKDKIEVYNFDVRNEHKLDKLFEMYDFDGVVHLAAKKYVDESVMHPSDYKDNNVNSTKVLLDVMQKHDVKKLLFASSVVVYGNPINMPVDETCMFNPISPYAETKIECEELINEWNKQGGTAIICRFSNPAGADKKYALGDDPKLDKKNLIPYICDKALNRDKLMFNGNDHPTRDGTPIRDYIHITDLTNIVARLYKNADKSVVCNVARGEGGITVLEVLKATEKALKRNLEYGFNPKRAGDISEITFSTKKLSSLIDYEYENDIEDIVDSQIKFYEEKRLKNRKR